MYTVFYVCNYESLETPSTKKHPGRAQIVDFEDEIF